MKVMFGTSVLLPAIWSRHPAHSRCVPWLVASARSQFELFLSTQVLVEAFSVLTRLPIAQRIAPADAWHLIESSVLPYTVIVELTATDYRTTLAKLAQQGIGGGVVYDALIAATAEKKRGRLVAHR
jgi:predicted nucleic acid-binding protein